MPACSNFNPSMFEFQSLQAPTQKFVKFTTHVCAALVTQMAASTGDEPKNKTNKELYKVMQFLCLLLMLSLLHTNFSEWCSWKILTEGFCKQLCNGRFHPFLSKSPSCFWPYCFSLISFSLLGIIMTRWIVINSVLQSFSLKKKIRSITVSSVLSTMRFRTSLEFSGRQ